MAIEILILSGARQGTRLVLEGNRLRIGTTPDCDVYFDPQKDAAARDHAALLISETDGWCISSAGTGGLIVNQQPVAGTRQLRSGDVVRLSPAGPDFSFRLPTGGANTTKEPLTPDVTASPFVAAQPEEVNSLNTAGIHAAAAGPESSSIKATTSHARHWIKWGTAGVIACFAAAVLWRVTQVPPAPQINIQIDRNSLAIPKEAGNADKEPPQSKPATTDATPQKTSPAPKSTPSLTEQLLSQLREALYLVEVEKAGRFWPYATCVAIGDDSLLTSGREALQLAAWRENEGYKIWAVNFATGTRKEIREIRFHGIFTTIADKPNDWIYVNLALLAVDGKMPKVAPLASDNESESLKEDVPVVCLGFTHDGKKTSATRSFDPQVYRGQIFMITAANDVPAQPRLLHVEAQIPQNFYGSPVVNEHGQVVGIYGSPAMPVGQNGSATNGGVKDIHLASLALPQIIRLWTEKHDEKMWVPSTALKPLIQSINQSSLPTE
jgi:hypothetical protein